MSSQTDGTRRATRPAGSARVVLGGTGGIAAYKAPIIARLLIKAGHGVRVIPTPNALQMVGQPTFAALTGQPVTTGIFTDPAGVEHVQLGSEADIVVIAPATAHTIAKLAAGMADNLLTATALVATCPVVVAPAMHTQMWNHPATQANIATLRERGVVIIEPAEGRLTGADSGVGRLPEPEDIVARVREVLGSGEGATQGSLESAFLSQLGVPGNRSIPCVSSAIARPADRASRWQNPQPARVPRSLLWLRMFRLM